MASANMLPTRAGESGAISQPSIANTIAAPITASEAKFNQRARMWLGPEEAARTHEIEGALGHGKYQPQEIESFVCTGSSRGTCVPAENRNDDLRQSASVPIDRSRAEIEQILHRHGVSHFAYMTAPRRGRPFQWKTQRIVRTWVKHTTNHFRAILR
jgi:hypothetical protein